MLPLRTTYPSNSYAGFPSHKPFPTAVATFVAVDSSWDRELFRVPISAAENVNLIAVVSHTTTANWNQNKTYIP